MGHCLSSCLKVRQPYKTSNFAFSRRTCSPLQVEMFNVVVEYDKELNVAKPKPVSQKSLTSSDIYIIQDQEEASSNNLNFSSKPLRNSASNISDVVDPRIESMYESYKNIEKTDCILAEGVEKFCHDLGLSPDQFEVLALAWKFRAETMCCFTRQNFIKGCQEMKVFSLADLREKLPRVVEEVRCNFKDFYRWTFKFGLEPPQRYLPLDMAIALWKLVFQCINPAPDLLPRWIEFLERQTSVTYIKQDTWFLFQTFVETFKSQELSNYTDAEAWPNLFDDFVEFENDRKNQNLVDRIEKDSDQHG